MSVVSKLSRIYQEFISEGRIHKHSVGIIDFCKYIYFRIRYGVKVNEYFTYKLYSKDYKTTHFYKSLHVVIHQWNNVINHFMPDISFAKRLHFRLDYLFSKILYPGLDSMDYFRYEFYNFSYLKRKTFITEGGLSKMDKYFNGGSGKSKYVKLLENKAEFNSFFSDYIHRKWILAKDMSASEFSVFCAGLEKVIVKPLDGGAGHGIYTFEINGKEDIDKLFSETVGKQFIIEEIIKQNKTIERINPSSVNTIRVYSVSTKDGVFITGATLRMGCGDKAIDNYSAGGLAAEIDTQNGMVISKAVSQSGESYYIHPRSQVILLGLVIPCWSEICNTVKSAHLRIPQLGYIGWDVVVCQDNTITFLEANTCAGVELQQHPGLNGKKLLYDKYMRQRL